jgi:hypothetical protein
VLTFVPPDTISRMPVTSTGFRGFARRQGLKASSMGRAPRVVRATSKPVATDSSRKWCLTAICTEARQGRETCARCTSTSGVGVSGRGEVRRVASAMPAIDRAQNSRLGRDALDRERYAMGDLTTVSAWVFHSCALPGQAPRREVSGRLSTDGAPSRCERSDRGLDGTGMLLAPSAPHGRQRCSRGLTSGFDFVLADKDNSRSLSKAECLTTDGPTRRRG